LEHLVTGLFQIGPREGFFLFIEHATERHDETRLRNTGSHKLVKEKHGRVEIIETWPRRLDDKMGHARNRKRVIIHAAWRIENEKIASLRSLGRLCRIIERFHRKTRRDMVFRSGFLPMDKRLLSRIEIGKDDIEAGMGTHGRQRAS